MKKFIALAMLLVTMVTCFPGCKITECDLCGDEGLCQKDEILDQEVYLCNDCAKDLKELRDF